MVTELRKWVSERDRVDRKIKGLQKENKFIEKKIDYALYEGNVAVRKQKLIKVVVTEEHWEWATRFLRDSTLHTTHPLSIALSHAADFKYPRIYDTYFDFKMENWHPRTRVPLSLGGQRIVKLFDKYMERRLCGKRRIKVILPQTFIVNMELATCPFCKGAPS